MGVVRKFLVVQNHVGYAQREYALHPRPAGNPFIGTGAGLRHARFDLREPAAAAWAALTHLAVTYRLRHGRVPSAQEIGAEGEQVIGAGEIERGKLRAPETQKIGLTEHRFVERLVCDHRRRAKRFEKSVDQFAALSLQGTR